MTTGPKVTFRKKEKLHDGVVRHISMGQEYGPDDATDSDHATVTIRHPSKKPKGGKDKGLISNTRESRLHVSPRIAKGLSVGDKVRIHLERC